MGNHRIEWQTVIATSRPEILGHLRMIPQFFGGSAILSAFQFLFHCVFQAWGSAFHYVERLPVTRTGREKV